MMVLGFDFGTHKIGVAVGQTLTKTATPLGILQAKEGVPDWHKVQTLILKWQPHALVVGLPFNMDDTESEMVQKARTFICSLEQHYGLPVHTIDERLSTYEARGLVKGLYKRSKNKQKVDDIAAQIILESWLQDNAL